MYSRPAKNAAPTSPAARPTSAACSKVRPSRRRSSGGATTPSAAARGAADLGALGGGLASVSRSDAKIAALRMPLSVRREPPRSVEGRPGDDGSRDEGSISVGAPRSTVSRRDFAVEHATPAYHLPAPKPSKLDGDGRRRTWMDVQLSS